MRRRLARTERSLNRLVALLFVGLLMAQIIPGPSAAYHTGPNGRDHPGTTPHQGAADNVTSIHTTPTLDQARDDILARVAAATAQVNDLLQQQGLGPRGPPAVTARVLEDHFDPFQRIGGIGDWTSTHPGWQLQPAAGTNATSGWTITNATTGKYATMDGLLISPALDLGPYALQLGSIPNAYRTPINTPSEPREPAHQVVLLVRQRYNFTQGIDGGQVVVFTDNPASGGAGDVVRPMANHSTYTNNILRLGGAGFTGYHDWHVAAFDLTPWGGRPVWIGFRAATDPRASSDPNYLAPNAVIPHGWAVDDVEVFSAAYPHSLKVYDVWGPTFRDGPTDPLPRAPTGENITVRGIVINAGSERRDVEARIRVEGSGPEPIERFEIRTLAQGEVWFPEVTFLTPAVEGTPFTVTASVRPSAGGTVPTYPDPISTDNTVSRRYVASDVRRAGIAVTTSDRIVDDDGVVRASVTIKNLGNVPLVAHVTLAERHAISTDNPNLTHTQHGGLAVALKAAETRILEWNVTTAARGEHLLIANATLPDGAQVAATTTYYVHTSPPPILHVTQGANLSAWASETPAVPLPVVDEWMWWGVGSGSSSVETTLRAGPTPEALAGGNGTQFYDLRLKVKYMAPYNAQRPAVEIGYVNPPGANNTGTPLVPWVVALPATTGGGGKILQEQELSWRTFETPVRMRARDGYADLWTAGGLELRVRTQPGPSGFFLDDLRLTAVPVGQRPEDRMELVRITGNDPVTVRPAEPSACKPPLALVATPNPNCWRVANRTIANESRGATFWSLSGATPPPLPGERGGAVSYTRPELAVAETERLWAPPVSLAGAVDPILTFEHAFTTSSEPYDELNNYLYVIRQVFFVDLQYLLPDGTWSGSIRLIPDDGYGPTPLKMTTAGAARQPRSTGQSYTSGDGYYRPPACAWISSACGRGEYFRNYNADLVYESVKYEPSPWVAQARFRLNDQPGLNGVNLADKEIRIGFNAPRPTAILGTNVWAIDDIRITPISTFAVDAAVTNITLDTAYDWASLGVGPGTRVPVTATVKNVGLYTDEFSVSLDISRLNGGRIATTERAIGRLAPGETRQVALDWDVPALDGEAFYAIRARVVLDRDDAATLVPDDNPLNDVAWVGADGTLRAKRNAALNFEFSAYPEDGRETLSRYLPLLLRNAGNVPLSGIQVTRTIERVAGGERTIIDSQRWALTGALEADPRSLPLNALSTEPRVAASDLFFVPGRAGTYIVSVRIEGGGFELIGSRTVVARDSIYSEDFDAKHSWVAGGTRIWAPGEGFQSRQGIAAANATSGTLPPWSDAWLVSPRIPIATAETASINLFTRYDFERGYDGGRVEVSKDGVAWHPLVPSDAMGRKSDYAETIVGSNPIAAGVAPDMTVRSFSGTSRDQPVHLDGWIPVSFNLAHVPELTETVVFRELVAPKQGLTAIAPVAPGVYSAPWMADGSGDEDGRWEIRNGTEGAVARAGAMWWSGLASKLSAQNERTLTRAFDVSQAGAGTTLKLSWWERRAGTGNSSWQGVGGLYDVRVTQSGIGSVRGPLELLDRQGPWTLVGTTLTGVNFTKPLVVQFSFTSSQVTVSGVGWAIEDIDLRSVLVANGTQTAVGLFTAPDELEWASWSAVGFTRVTAIPARPAPWGVVSGTGPNGLPTDMWQLRLTSANRDNVDTRLVTPVVDMAKASGSAPTLVLRHRHDLLWRDGTSTAIAESLDWSVGNTFQAGVVEIQVFDRTAGAWGPWKQLFAGAPPRPGGLRVPPGPMEAAGSPYNFSIPDSGDSFQRVERTLKKLFIKSGGGNTQYLVPLPINASYAFTGVSQGAATGAFVTSTFDLGPYAGERVRFAFHAASSQAGSTESSADRYWLIGGAELVGNVLSASDVLVRFHVGTDGSGLEGSWELDQFEIAGRLNQRSVGIHLDAQPNRVASTSAARIEGTIQNHGPETRRLLAVGLRVRTVTGMPPTNASVQLGPTLADDSAPGYLVAAGPFNLAPGGEPGSSARFAFHLWPGAVGAKYDIVVEALDGSATAGGLSVGPVTDDVPGRARRSWQLISEDVTSVAFVGPTPDPPSLEIPGLVSVGGLVRNDGTLEVNLTARVTWRGPSGAHVNTSTVSLPNVTAGSARAFQTLPVQLAAVGNHSVEVVVLLPSGAVAASSTRMYRVGTTDVAYSAGFDDDMDGWVLDGPPRGLWRDESDARFGTHSLAYGSGGMATFSATLYSPLIDLRGLGQNGTLSFWHKPSMGLGATDSGPSMGSVTVNAERMSGMNVACTVPLVPNIRGSSTAWTEVRVPLAGLSCSGAQLLSGVIRVRIDLAVDGTWRMDGFLVATGRPELRPLARAYAVPDTASKEYPFIVTNPGFAAKDVLLRLDARSSTLTSEQAAWVTIDPPSIRIAPGGEARSRLRITTPAAGTSFPQDLRVVIEAVDALATAAPVNQLTALAFRPLPRPDIALEVFVDGKRPDSDRLGIEEGIAHEITVLASNAGLVSSLPADLWISARNDDTGEIVWEHRERLGALEPALKGGEAQVVSASWRPTFGVRAPFTLRVVADPDRTQIDYDRGNDDLRIPLQVVRLQRPDLVVPPTEVRITTPNGAQLQEATPGQLLRVQALVRNDGYAAARDVTVRILAGGAVLKEIVVPFLNPGESSLIAANHLVPPDTVVYRIFAFTPDIELISTNNEHSVAVPVFPPDILIAEAPTDLRLAPTESLTIQLPITNTAPYPSLLGVVVVPERAVSVTPAQIALGPGETRNLSVTIRAPEFDRAAVHQVALRLVSGSSVQAQRTLFFEVLPSVAASAVVYRVSGPPGRVAFDLDVLNTGNVPLSAVAVIRNAEGNEIGRAPIGLVEVGRPHFATVSVGLPLATPPGLMPVSIELEHEGVSLDRQDVDARIEPWSKIVVQAKPAIVDGRMRSYPLTLSYRGNVLTSQQPVLLGVPAGVSARFNETTLSFAPGESREILLSVDVGTDAPSGLYQLMAAFIGPDAASAQRDLREDLVLLPLDLRKAKVENAGTSRAGAGPIRAGDLVAYSAAFRNVGDDTARNVAVALYVDDVLVALESVDEIPAGQTRSVRLVWQASRGVHAVVIAADPHGALGVRGAAFAEQIDVEGAILAEIGAARSVDAVHGVWVALCVVLVGRLWRGRPRAR